MIVIYLDEVQRLVRGKMDHMLLKPLEDWKAIWIASSATVGELEPMFQKRFPCRVATALPQADELVRFLQKRMEAWGIACDDASTLEVLSMRARNIPGDAIRPLVEAAIEEDRVLTRAMVDKFPFEDEY